VNPSLGVILQPSYLVSQVNTALTLLSEQAMIKRLNFCIWTEAHTVWIPAGCLGACKRDSLSERNDGRACAVGFDMSEKVDLTSCVVALRVDDDEDTPADTIELLDMEGEQEVRKTLSLNFSVELIPFFWIPEDTLHDRVKNERIPYDVWRTAKADPRLAGPRRRPRPDLRRVHHRHRPAVPAAAGRLRPPQRDAVRRAAARQGEVHRRRRRAGPQAVGDLQAVFEALVLLRRIRHAGNPVMGFCVSNAEPKARPLSEPLDRKAVTEEAHRRPDRRGDCAQPARAVAPTPEETESPACLDP
jgi:hypothetical protein